MLSELLSCNERFQAKNLSQFLFLGAVNSTQTLYTVFCGISLYILHNLSSALVIQKNRHTG